MVKHYVSNVAKHEWQSLVLQMKHIVNLTPFHYLFLTSKSHNSTFIEIKKYVFYIEVINL